jgi:SAM-dependent methyltransferase
MTTNVVIILVFSYSADSYRNGGVDLGLQSMLVGQFHKPSGLLGRFAGWIMATRASNLERNRWTVDLLEIGPSDVVLELGPGPGVTLGLVLEKGAQVVAVDHSVAMLETCRKRNKKAIDTGKLTLINASFTRLPEFDQRFDRIIAVNSLQFDATNAEALTSIVNCLVPGGRLAITFQPRGSNPTDEKALAFGRQVADLLSQCGLNKIAIEHLPMAPVCAICVLGSKAADAE